MPLILRWPHVMLLAGLSNLSTRLKTWSHSHLLRFGYRCWWQRADIDLKKIGPKQCKLIIESLLVLITKRQQDMKTD